MSDGSIFSPTANALTNARIVLHDGSSIVADIVDYRGDQITLSTSFSRDLKIDTALIKDIQASADDREVSTLLLKDGRRVETAPMMVTSGIMACPMVKLLSWPTSTSSILSLGKWDKVMPGRA